MKISNFKYLVIEDDTNVWANIERRMNHYHNWKNCGFSSEIDDALKKISLNHPHLIFSDWSIVGGNGFQILNFINTIENYKPYIIFFTGYQSEHPEIPQEIFNNFPIVKKYIIKPIYENLTNFLSEYIKEAEDFHNDKKNEFIFIENEFKQKIKIIPQECIAFIQNNENPRIKTIYFRNQSNINVKYTWEQIIEFAKQNNLDYFITNNRKSIINRKFISKIHKPFVWLNNGIKIEVAREKWKNLNSKAINSL